MGKQNSKVNVRNVAKGDKPPFVINRETVQATIPIVGVYEKYGLIETYLGSYVKLYQIGDNNYLTATESDQMVFYKGWMRLLNAFGNETRFALTINNHSINQQDFFESVLVKETGDEYDYLRKQLNTIIKDRINEGKNGIVKDKYLTVAVTADSPKMAFDVFQRMDKSLDKLLQNISSYAKPMSLEDALDILYTIYSDTDEHLIQKTRVVDDTGHVTETRVFDFENMRGMGLTVNDLIGPSSIQVNRDYMQLGNKYARVLKVSELPNQLSDEFLNNVTDMKFNSLTTINFKPILEKEVSAIVARNITFIREEKQNAMQYGQKNGIYDDSCVDPKILEREAEALALRDAIHTNDEKLFETSITVTVFADTKEKLDEYSQVLLTEYKKASVTLGYMTSQQEEGFNSTLPLCYNQILQTRTLTSSASAILQPFSTLELNDMNGINYSCNLISRNLLVYDRLKAANFNGFILGTPGSGKSFTAKVEMLNVFLKSNADIVIIDPENEYEALAHILGGEVINITPGGDVHINPLEIVVDSTIDDEINPVNAKADFVLRLMECILNSPFGINSIQQTIIDECVHALYQPFMRNGKLREIPPEKMPTLADLQVELANRHNVPEARELAMALKLYTTGSLNAFGFQTNVHTKNRFVVYQIRDIGDRLKPIAMLSILDQIWNQIVRNRSIGKNTYFYIDEIYLLFMQETSAAFLNTLFRRSRKYGGVPTGITQNVSPLLESATARDMLQNSTFIQILAQAGPDRDRLKDLLHLSESQLSIITNSPRGQGLLYNGSSIVPFYAQFPKDNDIYKCLTSDMKEIQAYKEQEEREKSRKAKESKL